MIFSIIICTYNPDERLLDRVLKSILAQQSEGIEFECLLIDNNSTVAVKELACVKQINNDARFKIISEPNPGLSHARIAGAKNAKGNTLIFVDDDNELQPDYLQNTMALQKLHPLVAVWGPGLIHVDYTDDAPGWVKKYFAAQFQQKNIFYTQYGCVAGWPDYYPAGSGLIVKKEIFDQYIHLYQSGALSSTDRKGNDLSSAGDSQIVWTAVKMGLPAGTSPLLKLNHLIPAKRTTLAYLKKLNYGVSHSYYKAYKETFPEAPKPFHKSSLLNKITFIARTLLEAKVNPVLFYRLYTVKNAWIKGYDDTL